MQLKHLFTRGLPRRVRRELADLDMKLYEQEKALHVAMLNISYVKLRIAHLRQHKVYEEPTK